MKSFKFKWTKEHGFSYSNSSSRDEQKEGSFSLKSRLDLQIFSVLLLGEAEEVHLLIAGPSSGWAEPTVLCSVSELHEFLDHDPPVLPPKYFSHLPIRISRNHG